MAFTLNIDTDNDAFRDDSGELARILRELADYIEIYTATATGRARDINGNTVGTWSIS